MMNVKKEMKEHGISHATIEMETPEENCDETSQAKRAGRSQDEKGKSYRVCGPQFVC